MEQGLYVHKQLTAYLDSEFTSRSWMFVLQPPQSPITNIKDACIFPALSKQVTAAQGILKGSLSLDADEIWKYAHTAFNNFPLDVIARSYANHHQIVNAIFRDEGRDDFTRAKNALHVGSRLHFLPYHEEGSSSPNGVVSVLSLDTPVSEEELERRKLRYKDPDVSMFLPEEFLNPHEIAVIAEHVSPDSEVFSLYENAIEQALHATL